MEITEVKVYPVQDEGRLRAYATIVFENCFIVRDLKIIEGAKGLFVSMPSRRRKDGTFRDVVHPLNSGTRETIERIIIEEFERNEGELALSNPEVSDTATAEVVETATETEEIATEEAL